MGSFGRRVCITWVLIMFVVLSSAKSDMYVELHVQITNSLEGNYDLSIHCDNIDPTENLLLPNTSSQADYEGLFSSSRPPFLCYFQWGLQHHIYNLVDPFWDFDCKQHCNWFIKQSGPCKYYGTKLVCFKWIQN